MPKKKVVKDKSKYKGDPWEKQPWETALQYRMFTIYRDLDVEERSVRRVCNITGRAPKTLEVYSAENKWVERAAAWDNEQDRIIRAENLKAIKKMRKKHADVANAMILKAAKALQRIPDDEISAREVSQMVDVASKLERISRGDVESVVETRDGGKSLDPVCFYMPSNNRDQKEDEDDE